MQFEQVQSKTNAYSIYKIQSLNFFCSYVKHIGSLNQYLFELMIA